MKTLNQLIDNITNKYGVVIFVDMARIISLSDDNKSLYLIEYTNHHVGNVMTNYKIERLREYKLTTTIQKGVE